MRVFTIFSCAHQEKESIKVGLTTRVGCRRVIWQECRILPRQQDDVTVLCCRPSVVQKHLGVDNKEITCISFVAGTRASLSVANIKNALQARFKVQLKRVLRLPMRDGNTGGAIALRSGMAVLRLPMRDGNSSWSCWGLPRATLFLDYLWGMETLFHELLLPDDFLGS